MITHVVEKMISSGLAGAFRRVVTVGELPEIDSSRGLVACANHNNYYDGHLMWLLSHELMPQRHFSVWMEELERFPFFARAGALPFPKREPGKRATTIRRTRRILSAGGVLGYFPEGELEPEDGNVRPFEPQPLQRLHNLLGEPAWLCVGVHVVWLAEARPTAVLAIGDTLDNPDGLARGMEEALRKARTAEQASWTVCFEGRKGPDEKWGDTILLRRLFK